MIRNDIIQAIETILRDKLNIGHMTAFAPGARLNEDLYLDSVLMLELMLALELEHGLVLPEDAFGRQDLSTVDDLARLYIELQPAGSQAEQPLADLTFARAEQEAIDRTGVHGEDYIDIKVHCVVSNLCYAVKKKGLDHRLFFFGVWDADFDIDDRSRLGYHTARINHDFYRDWFQRLYGPAVRQWYRFDQTKQDNVARMLELLESKKPSEYVMVMLDLFHLPERENKFNQNPFPHYLMLEKSNDPDIWTVLDPDFRWEGKIEKEKILNAIVQPTVAGGFIYDADDIVAPAPAAIRDYFLTCFREEENPLTAAARSIVQAHLAGRDGLKIDELALALRELPVISIRKYALEHGFAFFWRSLQLSNAEFDVICDEIEALIQEFKAAHYAILKLSGSGTDADAAQVFEQLDTLDRMESALKRRLAQTYRIWCDANGLAHVPTRPIEAAA